MSDERDGELQRRLDAIEGALRLAVQRWRSGLAVSVDAQRRLFEELLALSAVLQAQGAPPHRPLDG